MRLFVHIAAIMAFLMTGTVCFGDCGAMPAESHKVQETAQDNVVMPPCHEQKSQDISAQKTMDDCGQLMFKSDCTGESVNLVSIDNLQKPDMVATAVTYQPVMNAMLSAMSDVSNTSPRGPPPEYLARLQSPLPHITTQRLLI